MTSDTILIIELEERVKKLELKVEQMTRESQYWQEVAESYYEMGVQFVNGFERIMNKSLKDAP